MKPLIQTLLGPCLVLGLAIVSPAHATVIDFETQAAQKGGNLTGVPDSPLTIGLASFTGGELLHGEVGLKADATGVYASEGLFGSGETNPLVITFSAPVQDFSLLVLNGDDTRSYTVADDLGELLTKSLASAGSLGAATFALPGSALTRVTLTSANTDAWDFAIDNVTFTPSANVAPEPQAMLLSGVGLLLMAIGGNRLRVRLHS